MPRILLIRDSAQPAGDLRAALEACGHEVLDAEGGIGALLRAVEAQRPDVVVLDVESPSPDALEQLALLHRHAPHPVVMFSANGDERLIRAAVGAGVAAYVVDGLAPARLRPIIQVALARFEQDSRLRQQLEGAQQQLQDRKLIDQAKGLLMDKRGMSERDAYAALRQQAMRQNLKLADVARRVLSMADLLG